MKKALVALAVAMFTLSQPVLAKGPQDNSTTQQAQPNEADLQTHRHYINKDGQEVHSPSKSKSRTAPQGATAQCRDEKYSFSQHHRGTCSHHGGVATWLQ
jgi:hypothetical protein